MYTIVVLLGLASWAHCLDPEVQEMYEKLSRDDFVKYFNKKNFSWKIKNNDFVDEKIMRSVEIRSVTIPVKPREVGDVPDEFDASFQWPECGNIELCRESKNCSSAWAITATSVASDRICTTLFGPCRHTRHTRPHPHPTIFSLSENDLTCCKNCSSRNFCSGGSPEQALLFYIRSGIVTYQCKYELPASEVCVHACVRDDLYYMADKHFGKKMYVMSPDDLDIRRELFKYGPLLTTFAVYEDIKDYSNGIYEHTHGELVGHHSVKVIGYGEDEGVPYWLAVNSWGWKWGQYGMFKIKRFQEDIDFEKRMISVFPRMYN